MEKRGIIYEDLLEQEPNITDENKWKKWQKELPSSIGYIEMLDENEFNVVTDVDGQSFVCKTQYNAEVLSLLVQVNERLKRVENELTDMKNYLINL